VVRDRKVGAIDLYIGDENSIFLNSLFGCNLVCWVVGIPLKNDALPFQSSRNDRMYTNCFFLVSIMCSGTSVTALSSM
jgi:hypothetical protein